MKNLLVDKTKQKNNKIFWGKVEDEKKHLSRNQEGFPDTRGQSEGESMVCVDSLVGGAGNINGRHKD